MDQAFINPDPFVESTSSQSVHLDVLRQSETETSLLTTRPEVQQAHSFESYFEEYHDILDSGWPSPTPIEDNLLAYISEQPPCKCSATQISTANDENHTTAVTPTHGSSMGSCLKFRNTFVHPRNSSAGPTAGTSSSRSPTEVQSECLIRKEKRREQNRRAQNAYRKRKEQQVWELEAEIAQLRSSYQQDQMNCEALKDELDAVKAVLARVISNLSASAKAVGLIPPASLGEAYTMTQELM